MNIDINDYSTVRDVVVKYPQSRQILEAFGIDYCCRGDRCLADACLAAHVDLTQVVTAIDEAISAPGRNDEERSWADATLTALVEQIETTHHAYTKTALPRLAKLFDKVIQAHGQKHGSTLEPLRETFAALREEIEMHLAKEEQILFPYIREMEQTFDQTGEIPPMHCGSVSNPIRQMQAEHDNAGAALAAMRSLTDDYALPSDGCPTFAELYDGLKVLEGDLHQHIHLENNILFPRATKFETSPGGSV